MVYNKAAMDIFLVTVAILIEGDQPKDNPCQAWFNLVQGFQRRSFKCESLRRTTSDDKSSPGLWPGELRNRASHGTFNDTSPYYPYFQSSKSHNPGTNNPFNSNLNLISGKS